MNHRIGVPINETLDIDIIFDTDWFEIGWGGIAHTLFLAEPEALTRRQIDPWQPSAELDTAKMREDEVYEFRS
ncbi:hypothetical protein LBMAG12_14320 [Actinomycetes bacterium]|nr:hypothetical protein LBMAG12_14320 [Actinomycetes bacterium]